MADLNNPHDAFFRASMQNAPISQAFFTQYLPPTLLSKLDLDSFKLQNSTFIDPKLQETFSDLVFTCGYKENTSTSKHANVVLLIEHQSTADKHMAFRVYHYLFNMLYSLLKQRPKKHRQDKLPPIYALVFYHGKQTPYPYSLYLQDCFDDPLNIMEKMFNQPVSLIDVNQFNDDELKKQQLLGLMTGALKHSRDPDVGGYLIWHMNNLDLLDLNSNLTQDFIKTVLNYLLNVGNILNVDLLVENVKRLPERVKGDFMTVAEKLIAKGLEQGITQGRAQGITQGRAQGITQGLEQGIAKGREENREEVAINALKEGAEPRFVSLITGLDLAVVESIKARLMI